MRLRGERDLLSAPGRVAAPARNGPLLVLSGAVLWGTAGASQQLLGDAVPPFVVGSLRTVLGGAALVAVALLARRHAPTGIDVPVALMPRRHARAMLLLAGVCIAAYQVAFFIGVRSLGIAVGTILAIGAAPFFAGAAAALAGQGRATRRWLLHTGLAVLGLVLLVRPSGEVPLSVPGLVAALLAGLSFGVFTVLTKGLLARGVPRIDAVAMPFGIAAVLLLPVLAIGLRAAEGAGELLRPAGIMVVLWLALGATAAGYVLFIAGLRGVTAVVGTTLVLAEPLTAALLGVLVFAERLDAVATTGALLVAAALVLTAARPGAVVAR